MDLVDMNRHAVERFLAGTHAAGELRLDVVDSTVSPHIACHGFPGGNPVDHQSYKRFFLAFREAFDDTAFEIRHILADREFVAVMWRLEATHIGSYAGIAATGRRVDFGGQVFYRMVDAKIAETWLQMDQESLLDQIAASPACRST